MSTDDILPWIAAVLVGAIAPAALASAFLGTVDLFPWVVGVTLGHAIFLGLPVALLYRAQRWTRLSAALAAGFLIGTIPSGVFFLPTSSLSLNASVNGVATVINGVTTAAGWIQYFEFLCLFGICGATGALFFWLILWAFGMLKVIDPVSPDNSAPPRA